MKTFLFALSFVTSLFFNQLLAAPVLENPAVTAAFQSRFGNGHDAEWTELNGLYRVRFTLDGTVSNAYFNNDGGLVAVTRELSPAALPASLRNVLSSSLEGRWITGLFVLENENGKTYYVTLENADEKLVLQSVQGRKWTRYTACAVL